MALYLTTAGNGEIRSMGTKLVSSDEIRTYLAGAGHEPLSQAALEELERRGLPREKDGCYDAQRCLNWYLGRLRTAALLEEVEIRMNTVLERASEEIQGKPAPVIEAILRRHIRSALAPNGTGPFLISG